MIDYSTRVRMNKTKLRFHAQTEYLCEMHTKLPKLPRWIDKKSQQYVIAVFFVPMLWAWIDLVLFKRQVSRYKRNHNQTNFNSNKHANPCVGVNYGCPHIETKRSEMNEA